MNVRRTRTEPVLEHGHTHNVNERGRNSSESSPEARENVSGESLANVTRGRADLGVACPKRRVDGCRMIRVAAYDYGNYGLHIRYVCHSDSSVDSGSTSGLGERSLLAISVSNNSDVNPVDGQRQSLPKAHYSSSSEPKTYTSRSQHTSTRLRPRLPVIRATHFMW
jgi:hypothetical protein